MTGSRRAARHRRTPTGTVCRYCREPIVRTTAAQCGVWVHADGMNIYCRINLPGWSANFAEPS